MSDTQPTTMSEDFIVNIGIVLTPPEHTMGRIDITVEAFKNLIGMAWIGGKSEELEKTMKQLQEIA
tara:strand:+ start:3298 stop:3495 length:198 start_codon:yes stop_codon:yes gene_type:complete